jgi:hypothetical protein
MKADPGLNNLRPFASKGLLTIPSKRCTSISYIHVYIGHYIYFYEEKYFQTYEMFTDMGLTIQIAFSGPSMSDVLDGSKSSEK